MLSEPPADLLAQMDEGHADHHEDIEHRLTEVGPGNYLTKAKAMVPCGLLRKMSITLKHKVRTAALEDGTRKEVGVAQTLSPTAADVPQSNADKARLLALPKRDPTVRHMLEHSCMQFYAQTLADRNTSLDDKQRCGAPQDDAEVLEIKAMSMIVILILMLRNEFLWKFI